MASETAHGYHYMEDTDPLGDVADHMEELAESVGRIAGGRVRGTVNVTFEPAAASAAVTVNFAAAGFSSPPRVFTSKQTHSWLKAHTYVTSITANTASIGVATGDGTNISSGTTIPVAWEAVED